MQNKEPNKNKDENIFYDYFKNNLEDYQIPVDEKCWEYINQQVKPKKRNTRRIALLSGVVAIAMLVLITVLIKDSSQENQLIVSSVETIVEDSIRHDIVKPNHQRDELVKIDDSKIEKQIQQPKKSKHTWLSNKPEEQPKENNEIRDTNVIAEDVLANNKKDVEKSDSIPQKKKIDNLDFYKENDNVLFASNHKKSKKWELSASLGASPTTSGSPNENFFYNMGQVGDAATEESTISDVEYAPPFSVGILMRKRLNNTFSVETGVVYSFLSTTYKDIDKQQYSAKLKLHYVGIPINLVTDVWNITPKTKLYASTGVMVEKGIRSNFSQSDYQTKRTVTQAESIKGLQWSVNASVGASYKFYKGWNLYLEPHVSYYFDNDQPISIRTEKKTVLSINSGFRYEF